MGQAHTQEQQGEQPVERRSSERRRADVGPPKGKAERRAKVERRESVIDRRTIPDRRLLNEAMEAIASSRVGKSAAAEVSAAEREDGGDEVDDLNRRRGPGRRLSDFRKKAEEGELTTEQFLFLMAIESFKTANQKTYPAWTDVLEVVRLLGYRKTCPSEIRLSSAEDWRESAEAPSNVRPKGWEGRPGRNAA
jgi:hypothetical protein